MQRLQISLATIIAACLFPVLASAQNVFTLTDAEGVTGTEVLVQVLGDNDEDADGYQFGVCHNADELSVVEAVLGATSEEVNGGGVPGFFGINVEPAGGDGVTLGVVVDLSQINFLPVGEGHELLDITYSLDVDPAAEDPPLESIESLLEICDTLGSPAVPAAFIIDDEPVTPDLIDSTVTILAAPDFCIDDLMCDGGLTDVLVTWTICEEWDYILFHRDGEFIETLDGDATSYFDEDLDPGEYTYQVIGIAFPEPLEPAIIDQDLCSAEVIPLVFGDFDPKVGPYVGGTVVTITGQGFEGGDDFTVEFGGISALNITILDDETATCETPESTTIGEVAVTISHSTGDAATTDTFLYGFIRGDFNGNGEVSISDPIVALEYLFLAGDIPDCLDAIDTNDDGFLDVADPIFVLQYLFALTPEPFEPFEEAGLDPTEDSLDCLGVL